MHNKAFSDTVGGVMVERIERNFDFNMVSKHFHNEYEIYYLLEGERYYFINNQTYYIKKGSLVFVDRNKIHKTGGANTCYHDRILIQISEDEIENIFGLASNIDIASFFSKHFGVLELNETGQKYVEKLLFGIIDEMEKKHTSYEFLVKVKLAEILIFAIRCKMGENTTFHVETVKTEKHEKIHEIAKYITLNYKMKISLNELSKHFFVSKGYLSRILKRLLGLQ